MKEIKINTFYPLKKMGITNSKQALAQDIIDGLEDKKPKVFGMYMRLIRKFGEGRMRALLSEVVDDYKSGRVKNRVKMFMYRIRKLRDALK